MIPYDTVVSKDKDSKKGDYIASVKFNGKEFFGHGATERIATLDANKQVTAAAERSDIPTR